MRLRVCARALISFHHEAGQRVGARIPFIMSLPRAYSDFPCERAPFLIGVSVRPFVLGLRGPRFPASSIRRVRSFSSSCVSAGSDFPDVISFFSRVNVRRRAFFSSGVNFVLHERLGLFHT